MPSLVSRSLRSLLALALVVAASAAAAADAPERLRLDWA
jgi:hypothetical protein